MVRTGNNARPQTFGDPGADDEVPDGRVNSHQAIGSNAEAFGVDWMNPKGVPMRNLDQPLGVCRSRVNQSRQTKRRCQNDVTSLAVETTPVDL